MILTQPQESMFLQVESLLLSMRYGEIKPLKVEHPAYKNMLSCLTFIQDNGWDIRDNYYLIISPSEIRKETLVVYEYINRIEKALNNHEKIFLH